MQIPIVTKFLESFRSTAPGPARPLRTVVTPNDQERGPPETEEDKKVNALRDEISKRFKKHLEKAKNHEVISASESEAPKRNIQSKPMPRKHPVQQIPPLRLTCKPILHGAAVGRLLSPELAVR